MNIMKKYSHEERETAIKEIEYAPIKSEDWEGPHETKITSLRYIDDEARRKKKGFLSELFGKIKSILHSA